MDVKSAVLKTLINDLESRIVGNAVEWIYFQIRQVKKGETDIGILLRSMNPVLHDGEYVFCSLEGDVNINISQVLASFKEEEGITIVVEKRVADEMNLPYSFVSSWITLQVHSSLEAVGLTAAFSAALSEAGISCNVIAAFYHDHIFVPINDKLRALEILTRLSQY